MAGPMMLARALADGGFVVWDPPERPRLRVASIWAGALRSQAGDVREVLERAVCFRLQVEAALDRPGIPCLTLPDAPAPHHGACISCGVSVDRGWRCAHCLVAVYVALGVVPPTDLDAAEAPAEHPAP